MPGKMLAAVNQFFTRHHSNKEKKVPRKVWAFLEKNNDLLFSHFYNFKPFEGRALGKIANVLDVFLLNTSLVGISSFLGFFFAVIYRMLNFAKCLLAAEM